MLGYMFLTTVVAIGCNRIIFKFNRLSISKKKKKIVKTAHGNGLNEIESLKEIKIPNRQRKRLFDVVLNNLTYCNTKFKKIKCR